LSIFAFPLWESHYGGRWRGRPDARIRPYYRLGVYRLEPVTKGEHRFYRLRRVRTQFAPSATLARAETASAAVLAALPLMPEPTGPAPCRGDAPPLDLRAVAALAEYPYIPPPRVGVRWYPLVVDDVPDRRPPP
jgi:hypothetical protein